MQWFRWNFSKEEFLIHNKATGELLIQCNGFRRNFSKEEFFIQNKATGELLLQCNESRSNFSNEEFLIHNKVTGDFNAMVLGGIFPKRNSFFPSIIYSGFYCIYNTVLQWEQGIYTFYICRLAPAGVFHTGIYNPQLES
jgi:hypothetical protein